MLECDKFNTFEHSNSRKALEHTHLSRSRHQVCYGEQRRQTCTNEPNGFAEESERKWKENIQLNGALEPFTQNVLRGAEGKKVHEHYTAGMAITVHIRMGPAHPQRVCSG